MRVQNIRANTRAIAFPSIPTTSREVVVLLRRVNPPTTTFRTPVDLSTRAESDLLGFKVSSNILTPTTLNSVEGVTFRTRPLMRSGALDILLDTIKVRIVPSVRGPSRVDDNGGIGIITEMTQALFHGIPYFW